MGELIYFDNNSTTRLDQEVLQSMLPYFTENYANPSSQHSFGIASSNAVEKARLKIADLINCSSRELIFTSGATESLNIALKGLALQEQNGRTKIITVVTEHKAVLDICDYLEQIGFEIVRLPVSDSGLLEIEVLKNAIDNQTIAVCVMYVNNETGVVQPVKEIAEICHQKNVELVCDATQAAGKIKINISELGVDILALSAHKFHGPKGIGILYKKEGIELSATIHGGGHERHLRSGTLNVPLVVGMAKALELAILRLETDQENVRKLRDRLEAGLLEIPGTKLNGHPLMRLYNVSNISFRDLDANTFISEIKQLAVSNGSACTSALFQPSYVLVAMGLSKEQAFGSIRFSLSRFNTLSEVNNVITIITEYLTRTNLRT